MKCTIGVISARNYAVGKPGSPNRLDEIDIEGTILSSFLYNVSLNIAHFHATKN